MRRTLALALLGSVGLVAAFCWRRHHLHAVDGVAQLGEGQGVAPQVRDRHPPLFDAALPVFVLDQGGERHAAHTDHHAEHGRFIEHEDGSRSGAFQFDRRRLGLGAHQSSSIGTGHTADVARQPAVVSDRPLSVAIPRAA